MKKGEFEISSPFSSARNRAAKPVKVSSENNRIKCPKDLDTILEVVGVRICSRCSRRFLLQSYNDALCGACSKAGHGAGLMRSVRVLGKGKIKRSNDIICAEDEPKIIKPLRILCVETIARNIDNIAHFGHISSETKIMISKIVSRYRMLNASNCWLFCGPEEQCVHLYDCSNLREETLKMILSRSSAVKSLYLGFCGWMRDDAIGTMADTCQHIEELVLTGSFLVTDKALAALFEKLSNSLRKLRLKDVSRFNILAARSLSRYCTNISDLSLENCTMIDDNVVNSIASMKTLTDLIIEAPPESSVSEESLSLLISSLKSSLTKLVLSKLNSVSDNFLQNFLAPLASRLTKLKIEYCNIITAAGSAILVDELISDMRKTPLAQISFKRSSGIHDYHIIKLVRKHGICLRSININGVNNLSVASLKEIAANCRELEEIDVSWIRDVDDEFVTSIVSSCPNLKKFTIYGCPNITRNLIPAFHHKGSILTNIKFLGYEFI